MAAVESREPSSTSRTSTGIPQASRGSPASTRPTAGSSSRATTTASARPAEAPCSMQGSSSGTIGRPRAAAGASTPSSDDTVAASSHTERGSRLTAPARAPAPQTTNGTGRSPQSRWPWPPIPRPCPWSAIRITVAPSSLPRSSRKLRKSPTWRSVSASWSRYSGLRTPRTWPSWSAARSWSTSRSGSSSSTTRRPSAHSELSIWPVGCTEVTERTTSSPNGSSRWAIPTSRPRRPWRSSTSNTDSRRTPEPRGEVRAHPVLGRRGAGEHRGEADDGARRVGRLDAQVLGALAREAVHDRRVRLPEAPAVAAVHHDHVDALGERLGARAAGARARGSAGSRVRANQRHATVPAAAARPAASAIQPTEARPGSSASRLPGAEGHHELRHLLERVAAGGVRVGEHEPPEAQPVASTARRCAGGSRSSPRGRR